MKYIASAMKRRNYKGRELLPLAVSDAPVLGTLTLWNRSCGTTRAT